MFLSRFGMLSRWAARSRRFRHGPVLIVMLAATGSAQAPLRYFNSKFVPQISRQISSPQLPSAQIPAPTLQPLVESSSLIVPPSPPLPPPPQDDPQIALTPPQADPPRLNFPHLVPTPIVSNLNPPTSFSNPPDVPPPPVIENPSSPAASTDLLGITGALAASPPTTTALPPVVVSAVPEPTSIWILFTPLILKRIHRRR